MRAVILLVQDREAEGEGGHVVESEDRGGGGGGGRWELTDTLGLH